MIPRRLLRLLALILMCLYPVTARAISSAQVSIPAGIPISVSSLPNHTCIPPHASPQDAPGLFAGFSGPDNSADQKTGSELPPADADVAAGPNHVMAVVNNLITIYTKGGTCLYQVKPQDWFGASCTTCSPTDPKIAYDPLQGHWMMVMLNVPPIPPNSTVSQIMLSISQTSDPTGSWWNYVFDGTLTFGQLTYNDNPDIGFDSLPSTSSPSGAIYISTTQFFFSDHSVQTQLLYILPKSALYAGSGATVWRAWNPLNPDDDSIAIKVRTAKTLDPTVSVEYLLNTPLYPSLNRSDITVWQVTPTYPPTALNWTLAVNPSPVIGNYYIPPAPYECLYTLANTDAWLYGVVVDGGQIYSAFTFCSSSTSPCPSYAKIRYFQMQPPFFTLTGRTYSDAVAYLFYPAITVDSLGNMYLVNARTTTNGFLDAWDTGQTTGEIAPEPAALLQPGNVCLSGTAVRWGDYFGAAQDPLNSDRVWVIGEYAKNVGQPSNAENWGTWISELTFSPFFNLQCAPSAITIAEGSGGTTTCTVFSVNSFNGSVALSCANLPSGVSCSYNPTPVAPPANGSVNSMLTVNVGAIATPGTYTFQAVGINGALTRTTNVQLTIPVPTFQLSVSPSVLSAVQGSMGTGTITVTPVNGFTGSVTLSGSNLPSGATVGFAPNPVAPPTTTSTVTVSTSASTPAGPSLFLVSGQSGTITMPLAVHLNVLTANGLEAGPLAVDTHPTGGSNMNGVFEPGETVIVAPNWNNQSGSSISLTGSASFSGPGGLTYTVINGTANYGTLAAGSNNDCYTASQTCYEFLAPNPGTRPSTHWDATTTETLTPGNGMKSSLLHIGSSFTDVPPTINGNPNAIYKFVETVLHNSVTSGCTMTTYCPANAVNRAAMAVFLLVASHGSAYVPPTCTGIFTDVACPGPFTNWIEELYNEQITGGCSLNPLMYCPSNTVVRSAMAVFLLKAEHGPAYVPPACVGIFADVPCPGAFTNWIEEVYNEGITGGCSTNPLMYCPSNSVTRGSMAVFLTATFKLNLYQ